MYGFDPETIATYAVAVYEPDGEDFALCDLAMYNDIDDAKAAAAELPFAKVLFIEALVTGCVTCYHTRAMNGA